MVFRRKCSNLCVGGESWPRLFSWNLCRPLMSVHGIRGNKCEEATYKRDQSRIRGRWTKTKLLHGCLSGGYCERNIFRQLRITFLSTWHHLKQNFTNAVNKLGTLVMMGGWTWTILLLVIWKIKNVEFMSNQWKSTEMECGCVYYEESETLFRELSYFLFRSRSCWWEHWLPFEIRKC